MGKKNLLHLLAIMMVTVLSVSFVSCGSDDDNGIVEPDQSGKTASVPDPEGTITANMSNNNRDAIGIYGFCSIMMSTVNNFEFQGGLIYYLYEIASVENVKGISYITSVPKSGWTSQTAVIPGHGYVIRELKRTNVESDFIPTGQYARLYVTNYITNTSGDIIGCTIKYQVWNSTAN